jgi:hypothetical protein
MRLVSSFAVLGAVVAACSSSSSSTSSVDADAGSAESQCDVAAAALCTGIASCLPDAGPVDCSTYLKCADAQPTAYWGLCTKDLQTLSCEEVFLGGTITLPSDCQYAVAAEKP